MKITTVLFDLDGTLLPMIAENIGMKVFLLTDCLINKKNTDISIYPHGSFDELMNFIHTVNG